jgi:pilus assembly protein CpaC
VNLVTVVILLVVVLLSTFGQGHSALAGQSGGVNSQPAKQPAMVAKPQGSDMQATVLCTDKSQRRLVIATGTSTVIDLNVPLARTSVTTPEIAEVTVLSPRQLLVSGKSLGTTQLILWDDQNNRLVFAVIVEPDVTRLRLAIEEMSPESEVDVEVFNGAIVLSGRVPDVDMIDRIVSLAEAFAPNVRNQMVLAGEQQVLLRCTVVELNKRAIRQLGVNGWLAGDNIRDMWAVTQIGGINPSNISLSPIDNMMPTLDSNAIAFGTPGVPLGPSPQLSLIFPRAQMQLFFQALRRNNLLRVLAEPNLIALNGQTASFLAGGEFPIPVSQGISGAVTVEFREFGVRLSFTPTIIGRGMIRLHVTPEVSELDFSAAVVVGGFNVPGLTQRRAETTIELASGSTIAIAGLLKEELAGVVERIPGLGDIPILGQLFRSVDYRSQITELVILVTPEVVSAMGPDQVAALPGDSISIPDDWELFGLGLLEGQGSIPEPDSEEALKDKVSPKYRKYSGSPEQMSLHGPWGMAAASEVTE